ncbi:MAG TPA: AAA family ATPase [Terriglobales bacterium]
MSSIAAAVSASSLSSARPYPGLRPFEEGDSDWFFGRSGEINELLKRLRRVRFVAIVGPSGCGKSSLIKAGVLPSVRDGYLDSSWSIATFRPGEQPLDNLPHAVSAAISADFEGVRKLLDSGSLGLIKAIQAKQLASGNKLLILVDQFEELFQFAQRHGDQSQEEVKAFLKLLLSAASSDDIPLYLVLTMRMEWLSECATYVGLAEAINEGIYLVPQMSRRQFQQVILNPIDKANGAITTTLLDGMLNDLGGRSDQLPVLQHALMRLWERRRPGEPIDIADYDAVGTFSNCLSNHAEEIFAELSAQQQKVAELLFRSITQVYKNRKIRRPRPFSELASVPGMDATELKAVIEAFGRQGRSFLFTSEGPLGPSSVMDISHEALMRQWGRLAAWVEDEAEQEARLGRLREDAAEWDRTGRKDRSVLYGGYKLQKAEEVRPRLTDSKTEGDFLRASRKAERSAKLLRGGALFLPLLLLVAVFAVYAVVQQSRAREAETARAAIQKLAEEQERAREQAEKLTQMATEALYQATKAEEQSKAADARTELQGHMVISASEAYEAAQLAESHLIEKEEILQQDMDIRKDAETVARDKKEMDAAIVQTQTVKVDAAHRSAEAAAILANARLLNPRQISASDLFDISKGTVITDWSGRGQGGDTTSKGGSDTEVCGEISNVTKHPADMFSGSAGSPCKATVFADKQPVGTEHWIAWKTSREVTVQSLGLFAAHDGVRVRRSFSSVKFYVRKKGLWVAVKDYRPQLSAAYE